MRGKRNKLTVLRTALGITPAHAGKTFSGQSRKKQGWDHPRACGENQVLVTTGYKSKGSPPRMRGKQHFTPEARGQVGITPAHAGKTKTHTPRTSRPRDHPRACGENMYFHRPATSVPGSPPRMRGKPTLACIAKGQKGITPAHAGKTETTCHR